MEVSKTYLDTGRLIVHTELEENHGSAVLTVDAYLQGAKLSVMLLDGDNVVAGPAQGTGAVALSVSSPSLWSADMPKLYRLQVSLLENDEMMDKVTLPVGIREVRFLPEYGILVNGRREKLRGICLHQDVAGVGIAVTKSLLRQCLEIFKDMGCNAIRTSHNTPSTELPRGIYGFPLQGLVRCHGAQQPCA